MAAEDVLVSRELKSLQDELSASRKERVAATPAATATPLAAEPVLETPDDRDLRDQLGQFAKELTDLFQEAEKGVSAHPTQSVVGALLVGILIGRLLGRRSGAVT
jgi:ElaB/YqjD/DUF883 family membrane-anchored ribosome-binding protein